MRIFVTGARGLLGSVILERAKSQGWETIGLIHEKEAKELNGKQFVLDIQNQDRFEQLILKWEPDYLINCAALTDVDYCEQNPELAYEINGRAPGRIAEICEQYGVGICQISTDYVFGDSHEEPISEDASTDPRQVYGEAKLLAEQEIRANHGQPLITRISFLYGIHPVDGPQGLVKWIIDRSVNNKTVPLFEDQQITPTQAGHAAETILELLNADKTGTYHCSNEGCVTPYQYGQRLIESCESLPNKLERVSINEVGLTANRPKYTCLSVEKISRSLGRSQPDWQTGIKSIAEELNYYTMST